MAARHADFGLYAAAAALVLSCGATSLLTIEAGSQGWGSPSPDDVSDIRDDTDGGDGKGTDTDGDAGSADNDGTDAEDGREITIRIVIDDQRDGTSVSSVSGSSKGDAVAIGERNGESLAKRIKSKALDWAEDGADADADEDGDDAEPSDVNDKKREAMEEKRDKWLNSLVRDWMDSNTKDAGEEGDANGEDESGHASDRPVSYLSDEMSLGASATKPFRKIVKDACGDGFMSLGVSSASWAGGDGRMLVIQAYADGGSFESGRDLSESFASMMADVAREATKAGGYNVVNLALYGADKEAMSDGKSGVALSGLPSYDTLEWVAVASVDVPSLEEGAVGDVNHASVMYGGKRVSVDMRKAGFSSLPPEE